MSVLRIRGSGPARRRVDHRVRPPSLGLLVVGVGGTVVNAANPTFRPTRIPLVGRTTTVCSVTEPAGGSATARVAAVVSRQAPGREGRLTGTPLGAQKASLTITEQGKAEQIPAVDDPGGDGRGGRDGDGQQRGRVQRGERRGRRRPDGRSLPGPGHLTLVQRARRQ